MTYTEAARVAEENARWIRNNDAERMRKVEQLERARAVIAAALNIDPIVVEPDAPDPAPADVLPFVHPDDEPQPQGVRYNG